MPGIRVEINTILTDEFTVNLFQKNKHKTADVPITEKSNFFAKIKISNVTYFLLNSGHSPFIFDPVSENSTVSFQDRITIEYPIGEIDIFTVNRNLFSKKWASICYSDTNPIFYLPKKDDENDCRIIVDTQFILEYSSLTIIDYRFLKRKNPVLLISPLWEGVMKKGVICKTDYVNRLLEFDPFFYYIFIFYGNLLPKNIFQCDDDIFYVDIPIDKDKLNVGTRTSSIVEYHFKHAYNLFVDIYPEKITHLKIGDDFIKNSDPRFLEIGEKIIEQFYLVSWLNLKNCKKDSILNNILVIEVFPNKYGLSFPRKEKKTTVRKTIQQKSLSPEEIQQNLNLLLEEEQKENERKRQMELLEKEKRDNIVKKRADNEATKKLKILAKKIALECREYVVKRDLAKKRAEKAIKIETTKISKEIVSSIVEQTIRKLPNESQFIQKFNLMTENLWLFYKKMIKNLIIFTTL